MNSVKDQYHRACRQVLTVLQVMAGLLLSSQGYAEQASMPETVEHLAATATSHPFSAADHQQQPLALADYGYVEEEYLVSGNARVFDLPTGFGYTVLAQGPYTTRILVRRPGSDSEFSGIAIVESLNPSSPVDLPVMWAESYRQFMADGHAWIGLTIKPNTIKSLQRFDPARYGTLAMPHPTAGPGCSPGQINPWSQPTTPADETGLAWDILSQVGALLKSHSTDNPLNRPAERLFMTGQSQTAGYSRTYATFFGADITEADGTPLYDAYLYSGSPPWQVPIHQCAAGFAAGDPRLLTSAPGVPVIELFAEGDIGTNIATRRPDSDQTPDLFRRYEVAGASHVEPWEQLSFASEEDMLRATGQASAINEANCVPKDVEASDFPIRYVFNAAWRNLERWVSQGVPAPKAERLQLIDPDTVNPGLVREASSFSPAQAFVKDANGNAVGGVRTPFVDVPTARWVGAKQAADSATPDFGCIFEGYKIAFSREKLRALYPTHPDYVEKVARSAQALEAQGWLTAMDRAEIIVEAQAADVP
ncbi:MAG: alpha/beta hydrolase domain-containing protein [Pseudomonadales bacterium]|nr:alpha/beta hydrolase domain-containing protein [Pseudomonadales bacterium]